MVCLSFVWVSFGVYIVVIWLEYFFRFVLRGELEEHQKMVIFRPFFCDISRATFS